MDALRTAKVARLIQKELGELFRVETQQTRGVMVSVTEVRLSPDLSIARVFLSVFPDQHATELIEAIRERSGVVRYDLGKRLGAQLRRIPELVFHLDTSLEYARRIDQLLDENPVTSSPEEDSEEE